ncbi:MAG: NADH-quinone oxidoreductase subunit C [Candidatus Geothermarchaeales archaeon]
MSDVKEVPPKAPLEDVPEVPPSQIIDQTKRWRKEGYRIVESIVPVDFLNEDVMKIYYVLSDDEGNQKIFRTEVERNEPKVPSIQHLCSSAYWHEQEMHELFGIVFEGHPDLSYLLLREDWPGGFPHRKDYVVKPAWDSGF